MIVYELSNQSEILAITLCHKNLMASTYALEYQGQNRARLTPDDVHYSYFPLGYALERAMVYLILSTGGSIGFCQKDRHKMFDDIRLLRPTVLLAIPSVFSRLYKKFMMISPFGWFVRWYFTEAYAIKKRATDIGRKTPFLDMIVFSRFKRYLGGRVHTVFVASDGLLPAVHKEFVQMYALDYGLHCIMDCIG
jgi:long-chain acyl-CoA synthetase